MKIGQINILDINLSKIQNKRTDLQKLQMQEEQKDTVEISESGREKLKALADSFHKEIRNDNEIIEQISPKLARIRNKVEAGYYNLNDIESKIADKLADTITNELDNYKKME